METHDHVARIIGLGTLLECLDGFIIAFHEGVIGKSTGGDS